MVIPGDTLYSIAWRYDLNYHLLAIWNRIKPPLYRIYPGQRLRLRPPSAPVRVVKQPIPKTSVKAIPRPQAVTPRVAPPPTPITKGPAQPVERGLKLKWRWPTQGRVVQTFSDKDASRNGIQLRGVSGQPILAAEKGKVVYSGSGLVGYGNLIIIKHNNTFLSAYGYNKKLLVKEGDEVARGERIAEMGSPRNGEEPSLHFEIRKSGKPVNPLPLLPRRH
jgi:lipoprotein NlpD